MANASQTNNSIFASLTDLVKNMGASISLVEVEFKKAIAIDEKQARVTFMVAYIAHTFGNVHKYPTQAKGSWNDRMLAARIALENIHIKAKSVKDKQERRTLDQHRAWSAARVKMNELERSFKAPKSDKELATQAKAREVANKKRKREATLALKAEIERNAVQVGTKFGNANDMLTFALTERKRIEVTLAKNKATYGSDPTYALLASVVETLASIKSPLPEAKE